MRGLLPVAEIETDVTGKNPSGQLLATVFRRIRRLIMLLNAVQ